MQWLRCSFVIVSVISVLQSAAPTQRVLCSPISSKALTMVQHAATLRFQISII